MQIILIKPVRRLGKAGDQVNVSNGYGRNYLIPQELAIRATQENIAQFANLQSDLENKNLEFQKAAEKIQALIQDKELFFIVQSASDGRLFGSVTTKLIALEISKIADTPLQYHNVLLNAPIKSNGVYSIEIALHPDVTATILVVVAKSTTEGQAALKQHKDDIATKDDSATDTVEL